MTRLMRFTGICSGLGGLAWTMGCFVHNSLPQGCIGDACEGLEAVPMRGDSSAALALFLVAGVMLATSAIGMFLLARRIGGLGPIGAAALLSGGLGWALLLVSGMVSGFVDNDWSGMPALVVPGAVLLAVGAALLGWLVLRVNLLPRRVGLLLVGAALLLPFANEQTYRILLAVPFGVAWVVAGVVLLARAESIARSQRVTVVAA
jgi:hypothetical protein